MTSDELRALAKRISDEADDDSDRHSAAFGRHLASLFEVAAGVYDDPDPIGAFDRGRLTEAASALAVATEALYEGGSPAS